MKTSEGKVKCAVQGESQLYDETQIFTENIATKFRYKVLAISTVAHGGEVWHL